MYKLSVIVIIDKLNKNRTKTLESLLNQTLKDIQIICISEADEDNKELIEYTSKNNIILEKNINRDKIESEYVVFASSNTCFEESWAQKVYDYAKIDNEDMIICDLNIVDYQENKIKSYSFENIEKVTDMIPFLNWNLCNIIFKTEKVTNIQLANNKYNEILFILEAMLMCDKIGYAQDTKCYLYKKKSEMNEIEIKDIEELKEILKQAKEIYKKNKRYDFNSKELLSAIAFSKLGVESLTKAYYKTDLNVDIKELSRDVINFLDVNFFEWRNNSILKSSLVKKECLDIWYAHKFYKCSFVQLYLKLHKFFVKN